MAVLIAAVPNLTTYRGGYHWRQAIYPAPLMMEDVLWASNPSNWLTFKGKDSVYSIDLDFTKDDYGALLTDDVFNKLPEAYWDSLGGARSRVHFNYLLDRALQHLAVSRRLQNARAPELFLGVGASAGLVIAALSAIVVLRRRRAFGRWWELDRTFRLVLVVGAVWAVTVFLLQDETDIRIVLLPPLALVALYFAHRFLVDTPQGSQRPDA